MKSCKTGVAVAETKPVLVSHLTSCPEPISIVQWKRQRARPEPAFSVLRKPNGPFAWVSLLAAVFFLFSAPLGRPHESPPGCTGSGLGIDLFANIGDVHVGDTIRYSVRIF